MVSRVRLGRSTAAGALAVVVMVGAAWGSPALTMAAQREGRVVVYGTIDTERFSVIQKVFEGRYGVRAEYWRAAVTQVFDRALAEVRAGRVLHDVVILNGDLIHILKRQGAFAVYRSPGYEDFPASARDPDGVLSPPIRLVPISVLYNPRVVPAREAPRDLWDLLDARWRGRIVMPDPTLHTTTAVWLVNLRKVLGGRWRAFVEGLAAQQPALIDSFLTVPGKVIAGEYPVGIGLIAYVYVFGREGAPLDYVRLDPVLADVQYAAVQRAAPHPNAGRLFLDTLVSRASLLALAQAGDFVALPGVYPPIKDVEKLRIRIMEGLGEEELRRAREELGALFRRR